ncbi:MAG: hypothetical protein K6E51_10390 [Treponema sp.]|nr:hypothetical protein [Treponema sp.]
MTHKEKAVHYFSQNLHCSQAVLAAFVTECDITSEEGHQFCVNNKLFTEFCPKMVATAVEVVEEIILEQKKV